MNNTWKDAFIIGSSEHDDPEELRAKFIASVLHNINNCHVIRFLEEQHDDEVDNLIEVTFTNAAGNTVVVDGILESFNLGDWRMICDDMLEQMIERGLNDSPELYNWDIPRPHVTYVPSWNDDDIIDTVTIVWRVPKNLWSLLKKTWGNGRKNYSDVDELCPYCGTEFHLSQWPNVHKHAFCPACGKKVALCNRCTHKASDCTECQHEQ